MGQIKDLKNQVDVLDKKSSSQASSVSGNTLALSIMVVWVIVVTVALVVIGIISFRKWRRDYFMDTRSTAGSGSESQSSNGDYSDIMGSSLNVMMEAGEPPDESGGDYFNSGYEPDVPDYPTATSPAASVSVSGSDTHLNSHHLSASITSLDVHIPIEPADPPAAPSIRL